MKWSAPKFSDTGMTKWNWMCTAPKHLTLGRRTDIGAFTYIQAAQGVTIEDDVQIGGGCLIYSVSSIDGKQGPVRICKNARIGANSVVMPGVTVGENAIVGACSFVNRDIPANQVWVGAPARPLRYI